MTTQKTDMRGAVVLVNLGTPGSPKTDSVRRFLRRFLSDRRVVDLPRVLWLLLLNGIILPIRGAKVSRAYQRIWLEGGSPLKVLSERLTQRVCESLDGQFEVRLAMTYSDPDIQSVVTDLIHQGHRRIILLPLYPQYSVSTTAPVFDAYQRAVSKEYYLPELRFIPHYYQYAAYGEALANSVLEHWHANGRGDMLIFSFHGIPQRYATNGDPYPQHCEQTAAFVAKRLGLGTTEWRLSYQSRFGREPWLAPYTDELVVDFALQGVKAIDVISPAFATDCLETLDELRVELRDTFLEAGGAQLSYIPALNDRQEHAKLLTEVILDHAQGW
jgi:ferrochelatase